MGIRSTQMGNPNDNADNAGGHLKWQQPSADEESGLARHHQAQNTHQLTRTLSTASSAVSTRTNRRGPVDPALTLPIHYRSVYVITTESKESRRVELLLTSGKDRLISMKQDREKR